MSRKKTTFQAILKQVLTVIFSAFEEPKRLSKPTSTQPYIRSAKKTGLIRYWWSTVFYNNDNLSRLANGCKIFPGPGKGLIYHYLINGHVRYVGQTKKRSLKWRMTKRQPNGVIGYNYAIKRQMLNAYRQNQLQIVTFEVPIDQLDKREKDDIKRYAQLGYRLWNQDHNHDFRMSNYYYQPKTRPLTGKRTGFNK